jgi:recombination protein RecT
MSNITPIESLKHSIKALESQFKMALPSHVSTDRFIRTVLTAIQQTPDLVQADRNSLFGACMKAASQGLQLDGKEAALVTFRSKDGVKVQYMPMLSGLLKLVRNSGELSSITSQIIYEKDKYWVDSDGEHLNHEPNMFVDRGTVIGCYALAKTKDNAVYIEVLTMDEINAVRSVSRSKDSGPWAGAFKHEMYKKTALRRLIKRLPVSTDLDGVLKADDETYDLTPEMQQEEQAPQEKTVQSTSRLEKLIGNQTADETLVVEKFDVNEDEVKARAKDLPHVKQKPFNHAPGADNSEVPI